MNELLKIAEEEVIHGRCDIVGYAIIPNDDNPLTELRMMDPMKFDLFAIVAKNKFALGMRKIKLHDRTLGESISAVRAAQLVSTVQAKEDKKQLANDPTFQKFAKMIEETNRGKNGSSK